jgi:peptidyl-prolyl cis-trans isomerase A (cyclophilin A)
MDWFGASVQKDDPAKSWVGVEMTNMGIPEGDGPLLATIETSLGTIVARLYEKEAPKTVANFVGLATGEKEWRHPKSGVRQVGTPLYDGTSFHRVIPNFMIQTGDRLSHPIDGEPGRAGSGNPGYRFADEFSSGLKFDRPGLLGMANIGLNTNGSQWFITEVATPHLNDKHTIFGEVSRGFEIVPKIARVPTAEQSRPVVPVTIRKITIARGK